MLSFPPWKDEIMVWRMSERSIFPSPFTSLNPIAPLEILFVIALVTAPVKSPEMSKPEFDAFALVTVFVPVDFDAVFVFLLQNTHFVAITLVVGDGEGVFKRQRTMAAEAQSLEAVADGGLHHLAWGSLAVAVAGVCVVVRKHRRR